MLSIATCDDDKGCLEYTEHLIKSWAEESGTKIKISSFDNGDEFLSACKKEKFDIVFMDIVMPLFNGIDTARELRKTDKDLKIVFLTNSPEFALDSYSVKAFDYIIKPVVYNKIKEALDTCKEYLPVESKNLTVKTLLGYKRIFLHEIEFLEAQNKQVVFYLRSDQRIEVSEPLYTFEQKLLLEDGFFKCHRSYIVYIPSVDYFNTSTILTKTGKSIPIARGLGKAFQEAYFSFMFD